METINYWKTSDIKLSTDSGGCISAEHKYAGRLIDSHAFWADTAQERRNLGRRAAVEALNEKKLDQELTRQERLQNA